MSLLNNSDMALDSAEQELKRAIAKVQHLRSVVIRQRVVISAYGKLHEGMKKGTCDLAAENLRLVEENAALKRLLKL